MGILERYKNWIKKKDFDYFTKRENQLLKLVIIAFVPILVSAVIAIIGMQIVEDGTVFIPAVFITIICFVPFFLMCAFFAVASNSKYQQVYPKRFHFIIENTVQKIKHETMAQILVEHNIEYNYDASQYWNELPEELQKWWEYCTVFPVQYQNPPKKSFLDKTKKEQMKIEILMVFVVGIFGFFGMVLLCMNLDDKLTFPEFFLISVGGGALIGLFFCGVWFNIKTRKEKSKRTLNKWLNYCLKWGQHRAKEELEEEYGIYYHPKSLIRKLYAEIKEELYEFY